MGLRGTLHILPWMAEPSQRSPCRALLREDERTAGGLRPAIHRAARSHRSARWVACDGARSHRNSLSGRFRARRDVAPHPLAPGSLARSRSAADEEGSLAFTINATSKRHPPRSCARKHVLEAKRAPRGLAQRRPMPGAAIVDIGACTRSRTSRPARYGEASSKPQNRHISSDPRHISRVSRPDRLATTLPWITRACPPAPKPRAQQSSSSFRRK